ncbi:MAG: hypothetical protein HXY44_07695 [Syntrophaceae bacterium]|nr:hypothetical protein [Syntrophaceae bacterium]
MKKLLWGTIFLAWAITIPTFTMARVDVNVSIPLPPPIVFPAPPQVIVIPETYVYVVPEIDIDIFFYGGWWWRPWGGRWYRSRAYDSGWVYYQGVPSFYRGPLIDWRIYYRDRVWRGHPWDHRRVTLPELRQNWRNWEKNRYWERQHSWGVRGLEPRKQPPHGGSIKPQPPKPQERGAVKPQPSKPQERRDIKPQPSGPQHQEGKPHGKPGGEDIEKPGRK